MSFLTGPKQPHNDSENDRKNLSRRQIRCGSGRTEVVVEVFRQGRDLIALVKGGQVHVGATAVAVFPEKEADADCYLEVIVTPGHREGPLAEEAARSLAMAAQCTCVAIVGIHQDNATRTEISAIVANARQAIGEIVDFYRY